MNVADGWHLVGGNCTKLAYMCAAGSTATTLACTDGPTAVINPRELGSPKCVDIGDVDECRLLRENLRAVDTSAAAPAPMPAPTPARS